MLFDFINEFKKKCYSVLPLNNSSVGLYFVKYPYFLENEETFYCGRCF